MGLLASVVTARWVKGHPLIQQRFGLGGAAFFEHSTVSPFEVLAAVLAARHAIARLSVFLELLGDMSVDGGLPEEALAIFCWIHWRCPSSWMSHWILVTPEVEQ